MSWQVAAQTSSGTPISPTVADDGEPYAGISLYSPSSTGSQGAPPANAGNVCNKVGGATPPCVFTGQYSRYRTSVNANETTLAGITSNSASSFGLTNFLQFPSESTSHPLPEDPSTGQAYAFEPVPAQPLYITNLTDSGGTKHAGVVVAGSLGDYLYAYDTTSSAQLPWSPINLATQDCGLQAGQPFNNNFKHNPGGTNLPYYGIVATPVIDVYPGIATAPTVFVVSACVTSAASNQIQWNLDAINLQTGGSMGSTVIQATGFNSSYQLSRASLLLTHPSSTSSALDIAFGTGSGEVAAATTCPSGFTSCSYSGWMFLYSVVYNSSSSVTLNQVSTFATSGTGRATTNIFPAVYAQFNTECAPYSPSGIGGINDRGDNWAVSQGGIWMSSGGPSSGSTTANNVYAASGNGPFGCTSADSQPSCPTSDGTPQQCTSAADVTYWGESAIKFPAGTLTPSDFFSPFNQRFTTNSHGDPMPALHQTEELSRLDLDFGSTPPVIAPLASAPMFAMLGDKSGYMYVVPAEPNGTGVAAHMGEFQTNDSGLMSGAISTQPPFQASQLPQSPNTGNTICPLASNGSPWTNNGTSCDEIHEIAFINNLAIVWPVNESAEVFQAKLTENESGPTYQYQFNTMPVFNPCPYTSLPAICSQSDPQFPSGSSINPQGSSGTPGAAMAIASGSGNVSLWAIAADPYIGGGTWGWLYAYSINLTTGGLSYWWDSGSGLNNCSQNSKAQGWLATAFTEPTLANGAAYVPSACVVTGVAGSYKNCSVVPSENVASGILVFSSCSQ